MAESNIEKHNMRLTQDERRNSATKAGIASGKARREKKTMKETLESLLSMPLKSGECVDVDAIKDLAALKGKNIIVQEAIMLAQIQKAMKGDTKAAEYIRDTSGNKPVTVQNVTIKDTPKLADVISQLGASGLSDDE